MSPHRKLGRYLGIRGWLLLLCAGLWCHIGLGVLIEPDRAPTYFYEEFPLWLRVAGWWLTGGLAAWAAVRKTLVFPAVPLLLLMPLERLAGAIHAGAAYQAVWYLFMLGIVAITAHVKEPTRQGGS